MTRVQCMTDDEIGQYQPVNKKAQLSLGIHHIILFEESKKILI